MTDLDGRLPGILDSVAGGVTVLDRSGTVRFANAAAARLLGRIGPSDLIGKSGVLPTDEYELLDAGGSPLPPDRMPTRRVLAGEPRAEEVIRLRRRGSQHDRYATVRARLIPGEGAEDDLVVTAFSDVTPLKPARDDFAFCPRHRLPSGR